MITTRSLLSLISVILLAVAGLLATSAIVAQTAYADHPDEELEIEVEFEDGEAKVKIEMGDDEEDEFTLDTTDEEEVIEEILDRYDYTEDEVRDVIEFETEMNDDDDDIDEHEHDDDEDSDDHDSDKKDHRKDLKDRKKQLRDEYKAHFKKLRDEYKARIDALKDEFRQVSSDRRAAVKERIKQARKARFIRRCEMRNERMNAVDGFGAAYNVHSATRKLLIQVHCDPNSPDFSVTVEADKTQYVYKYGYKFNNDTNKWERFMFEAGDGEMVGDWILGSAVTDVTPDDEGIDDNHIVAYVCTWVDGGWKCGCSDSQCARPKWQLQTIPSFEGDTPNETPNTDETTEPDTTDTTTDTDAEAQTHTFDISATNFDFSITDITVKKGDTVVINLTSDDGDHDWTLDEFNAQTNELDTGESDSIRFVADQVGTFEYYCSVAGHRQLGMVGTLTVEE